MAIITITSDFGTKDGTLAILKGSLLSKNDTITIVDISNEINPFDLIEASYVIRNAYLNFPKGSIHLVCVDAINHPIEKPICALINGHYFICNNNGLLSLLSPIHLISKVVEISLNNYSQSNFLAKEVFVDAAFHLSKGLPIESLGSKFSDFKVLQSLQPTSKENQIIGFIIYVDRYGNAISNITKSLFEETSNGRKFTIHARNHKFMKLMQNYSDIVLNFEEELQYHGKSMALFNSNNLLEIAMYKSNHLTVGGASSLLGLNKGEKIIIDFK